MVMMEYIILFLQKSPLLQGTRGGGTMRETLMFGGWVVALFAAIFLFYTHSFLIRRRYPFKPVKVYRRFAVLSVFLRKAPQSMLIRRIAISPGWPGA